MEPTTPPAQLLDDARRGSIDALEALVRLHEPQVRSQLEPQIGPHFRAIVSAEDVMQITCLEAFLDWGTCRAQTEAEFVGWFRRIAQHNLISAIQYALTQKRDSSRQISIDASTGDPGKLESLFVADITSPTQAVSRKENAARLHQATVALPQVYREVVEYLLQGLSIGEIANRMGRTPGAIAMIRSRACVRLHQSLGDTSDFFTQP